MGAGYWALVIQMLSAEAIYLFLILRVNGMPNLEWSATAARRLWLFGSQLMAADLVNYVSNNGDKFLIARFLGPTSLGIYSLAFRIPQLTLGVLGPAARVVLPTFSRLQDDRARLARAYLQFTESVLLVICPAMTVAILAAPIGVPAVFGESWVEATKPLQILAAMVIPYILISNMGPLTVAVGRADWEFRWSVVTMVTSVVSFPIGLQWGIVGLAWSYLLMMIVLNPLRFVMIQRLIPISATAYLRALAPASTCSIVLGIVYLVTENLLQGSMHGLVLVAVASMTGASAYVICLRLAWPRDFRRQLDLAFLIVGGNRSV
jgi:PST family polysaccharide transporter